MTARRIRFDVVGLPAPQGSKTAVVTGGRARVIEAGGSTGRARHRNWRLTVAEAARDAWGDQPPIDRACRVGIEFRMPRPKSAPKRALWADKRPDCDKLARACLDSLTEAGVLADDSRVVDLWVVKMLADGWTGARIDVAELS